MSVSRWLSTIAHQWGSVSTQTQPAAVANRKPRYTHTSILWVTGLTVLTLTIGHRFYNEPKLDVGTFAPETIRAPQTDIVEDTFATNSAREDARRTVKVYTIDSQINLSIHEQIQLFLDEAQKLRQIAGSLPIVPVADLPITVQRHLRQVKPDMWHQMVNGVLSPSDMNTADLRSDLEHESVLALQNYRKVMGLAAFRQLVDEFESARSQYQRVVTATPQATLQQTKIPTALLDLSLVEWQQTQTGLVQVTDRILAQGIVPGLHPDLLQKAVRLQVTGTIPELAQEASITLLTSSLRANVIPDPLATQQQADIMANTIAPMVMKVKKGDVIVRKGFPINQQAFDKLEHFHLTQRHVNFSGLFALSGFTALAIQVIVWIQKKRRTLRYRDYWLLLLLTTSVPFSAALGLTSPPLPLMGLLIGSFHGALLGLTTVSLLTGAMVLGGTMPLKFLLSSAVGAALASVVANRLRSREELALLGGAVGLTQGTTYLLLHLITYGGSSWVNVIGLAMLHGATGFAWCVVALGVSPYLEHLFDLITPIRLAELSSPNRPLLQRLATEAPGTFQHTLFVSTLAEAAARALDCNVELVRAGCLYHDIGKMHDPLAFIENQLECENKHDLINDPWVSADLIKKHVTEGIVMARKHRLPKAIEVFIPEHQGTMLIAYFYHQAQLQAQENPDLNLQESDFRYDGPAPQSRETAIVMLADSCEAALRSLKNVEGKIALSTVHKIFKARWHDHQLDQWRLRQDEMPKIAEIFVRVWQEHHHQRIAYPKMRLKAAPSPPLASSPPKETP